MDGVVYPDFCELKCSIGQESCTDAQECPAVAGSAPCGNTCYVAADDAIGVGESIPGFLCEDRNENSLSYQEWVTPAKVKEIVWIAYFGSCT